MVRSPLAGLSEVCAESSISFKFFLFVVVEPPPSFEVASMPIPFPSSKSLTVKSTATECQPWVLRALLRVSTGA